MYCTQNTGISFNEKYVKNSCHFISKNISILTVSLTSHFVKVSML